MITTEDIEKVFPYKEYYPNQLDTIKELCNYYIEDGNDKFVLEAATGAGKSIIASTVGKLLLTRTEARSNHGPSIIICTKTKALQTQYKKLKGAQTLWSATNYSCNLYPRDKDYYYGSKLCEKKDCEKYDNCNYKLAKDKFIMSEVGVLNYHYFMHSMEFFPQFLVFDEAHSLEQLLCDYLTLLISARTLERIINIAEDNNIDIKSDMLRGLFKNILSKDSIDEQMRENLQTVLEEVSKVIQPLSIKCISLIKSNVKVAKAIASSLSLVENLVEKLQSFLKSNVDWVLNKENDLAIALKPLEVTEQSNKLFKRSKKLLFMSANIDNPIQFGNGIGLEPNSFGFKSTPSAFPVENRKIWALNISSVNNSNKVKSLVLFTKVMDSIVDKLTELADRPLRGIIHSVSYENARLIIDNSKHYNRMVIPNNAEMLNLSKLILKKRDTIIVSPAAYEGTDLYDDLSRFQFIPKIPYPYLGDKYIKTKMERDYSWYLRETRIKIVQSVGRSIRSPKDWCYTFILDSNFMKLWEDPQGFSNWFREGVILDDTEIPTSLPM